MAAARTRTMMRKGNERFIFLRMHRYARYLATIAAFRRRWYSQRFRPLYRWNRVRTKARIPATMPLAQGLQNFFRRDWNLIDPNTDSIVHGICDCRWNRQQRALPNFFRTEWPIGIRIFNQKSLNVAHLQRGRTLIFQHRRELVHDIAITAIRHLFHQYLAQTHVHAAFDLSHHE